MRLIIPPEIESKLHAYVMAVQGEIAGMGKVKIDEETGDIVVEDICIYDQEVTGGTADLSTDALAAFMMEKIQAGESLAPWILWWHSHSHMAAFFSGRDTSTIDGSTDFQHLISLVVNKRRERECRIDTFRPFRLTETDVPVVVPSSSYVVPEDIRAEVAQKVKEKVYAPAAGFGSHHHEDDDYDGYGLPGLKKVGSLLSPYRTGYQSLKNENGNGNAGAGAVDDDFDVDLDSDQMKQVINGIKQTMQAMVYAGKDESEEYVQMTRDLADYEYELAEKEREEYLEALGGNENEHGTGT